MIIIIIDVCLSVRCRSPQFSLVNHGPCWGGDHAYTYTHAHVLTHADTHTHVVTTYSHFTNSNATLVLSFKAIDPDSG